MPLTSADPFGGVIITDWYAPAEVRDERFTVNICILGRDLRADGIRAAVFRQRQDPLDGWVDAEVSENTAADLENAILTGARELRIAGVGGRPFRAPPRRAYGVNEIGRNPCLSPDPAREPSPGA